MFEDLITFLYGTIYLHGRTWGKTLSSSQMQTQFQQQQQPLNKDDDVSNHNPHPAGLAKYIYPGSNCVVCTHVHTYVHNDLVGISCNKLSNGSGWRIRQSYNMASLAMGWMHVGVLEHKLGNDETRRFKTCSYRSFLGKFNFVN